MEVPLLLGRSIIVLISLGLLLPLMACGRSGERSDEPDEGSDSPETTLRAVQAEVDPALKGTEWVLVSLNGEAPAGGTRITLEIGKEGLGGYSGCNGYGGGFEAMDDGKLELSRGDEQIRGTTVGCPGERGRQERSYMEALHNAASYRLSDDRLEIRNAEGTTTLVYEREPQWASDPADLVGTRWKLDSFNGEPPDEDYTPAISFHSKTRYSGYDGCLRVRGTYEAGAEDLLFLGGGEANAICMKPEDLSRPPGTSLYEEAVGEGKEYRLIEGRLEMRSEDGDTYVFVPLREGETVERDGDAWILERFAEEQKATPALKATEVTLKFEDGLLRLDSGEVSGSAGCNTYTAGYVLDGDELDFERLAATKMACGEPIMEQEQRYLSFFEDVKSYYQTIDGRLHLVVTDGRELVFTGRK